MLLQAMWHSVDKWVSVYLALKAIKDDEERVFGWKVTYRIIELCVSMCVKEREGGNGVGDKLQVTLLH